jgi:hypothetical protein
MMCNPNPDIRPTADEILRNEVRWGVVLNFQWLLKYDEEKQKLEMSYFLIAS